MIKYIYNYVNLKMGLDISKNTRDRKYVEARAVFYYLCLINTKLPKLTIGKYVGRNHCAVIHAISKVLPQIKDKELLQALNNFNSIDLISNERELIASNKEVKTLTNEVIRLNNIIESLAPIEDSHNIVRRLNLLNSNQLERAMERINAMLFMISNEVVRTVSINEMKGAEL
jgi:hypothetical protein